MAVSFLDIVPKPATETFTVNSMTGPIEVELRGVDFTTLAQIAKEYPAFQRLIEGVGSSLIDASDAMPSLIAAGLGYPGDRAYQDKVKSFPTSEIMAMGAVVIRLTFPATTVPLSPAPEVAPPFPLPDGKDAGTGMQVTSLRP
jgi:hypothetical protein